MKAFEPIEAPPDERDGQRPDGCLHIAVDVDWGRWRYCGRPVHRGAWCTAHYAACHRWRGLVRRQRLGEDIVRMLTGVEIHDVA